MYFVRNYDLHELWDDFDYELECHLQSITMHLYESIQISCFHCHLKNQKFYLYKIITKRQIYRIHLTCFGNTIM